eukprot:1977281-Rhodomonas_salina.1
MRGEVERLVQELGEARARTEAEARARQVAELDCQAQAAEYANGVQRLEAMQTELDEKNAELMSAEALKESAAAATAGE